MLGLQPFNIITHKKETIRFRMEAVEVRAAPTTGPTQASHNWLTAAPTRGKEIQNPALAEALQQRTEFDAADRDRLGMWPHKVQLTGRQTRTAGVSVRVSIHFKIKPTASPEASQADRCEVRKDVGKVLSCKERSLKHFVWKPVGERSITLLSTQC